MSTHADEGRLLAYVDGELPADERGELAMHLRECLPCRRGLDEARARAAVVTGALAQLDRPAPLGEAWAAVQVALGPDAMRDLPAVPGRPARTGRRPAGGAWGSGALARAAGLVLLLAGGAAAAVVPGSPLREWLFGEAEAPAVATAPAAASGLFTEPVDGSVEFALAVPVGTEISIRWGGQRAGVSGPASTEYASPRDGLVQVEAEEGPLTVELPQGIRNATLRVNDEVVLTVRDGASATLPPGLEGPLAPGSAPVRFRVR